MDEMVRFLTYNVFFSIQPILVNSSHSFTFLHTCSFVAYNKMGWMNFIHAYLFNLNTHSYDSIYSNLNILIKFFPITIWYYLYYDNSNKKNNYYYATYYILNAIHSFVWLIFYHNLVLICCKEISTFSKTMNKNKLSV